MSEGVSKLGGWLPLLAIGVPIVGALASLYLMTNTAYTTATALEKRVLALEAASHSHELELRSLCAALVETETQFRASDELRNLTHADDMRLHAMLWQKTFGSAYPTDNAYYPTIAQDHPQPCG